MLDEGSDRGIREFGDLGDGVRHVALPELPGRLGTESRIACRPDLGAVLGTLGREGEAGLEGTRPLGQGHEGEVEVLVHRDDLAVPVGHGALVGFLELHGDRGRLGDDMAVRHDVGGAVGREDDEARAEAALGIGLDEAGRLVIAVRLHGSAQLLEEGHGLRMVDRPDNGHEVPDLGCCDKREAQEDEDSGEALDPHFVSNYKRIFFLSKNGYGPFKR